MPDISAAMMNSSPAAMSVTEIRAQISIQAAYSLWSVRLWMVKVPELLRRLLIHSE